MERFAQVRAIHWVALSGAILVVDYFTGPFIQFPILFVFPVTLATVAHGRMAGSSAAVVLPLLRLSFFSHWPLQSSWPLAIVDTGVDAAILVGTSVLLDRMLRQERELRVLQGLLPICSFCKKIRDDSGQWRRLETYIAARSHAQFSHTVCPECGPRHYPGLMD